jgi:hypothetical protein
LIPTAVEESLCCFSILAHSLRANEDVEVLGCPIKKDDLIVIMHSAANRDAAEFPEPTPSTSPESPIAIWRSRSGRTAASGRIWPG